MNIQGIHVFVNPENKTIMVRVRHNGVWKVLSHEFLGPNGYASHQYGEEFLLKTLENSKPVIAELASEANG